MTMRARGARCAGALLAVALCPGRARPAIGQDAPPARREGPVVRVTVGLVQIDAVVTDRQGRHVTDLAAADFVVREGGQEREIMEVSYVALTPLADGPAAVTSGPTVPGGPPTRSGGRAITLVVDDLHVSYEGMHRLREALHRYLDERLAPGDRVAILRTGGGVAALQQFTSDVPRLQAAVDGLRFNYQGLASLGGPAAIDSQMPFGGGPTGGSPSGRQTTEGQKELDRFREGLIGVGTLGTLRWIVRGLAPLPGRKPVVVFSDGFKVFDFREGGRMEAQVRALTDEANRASVALYTVDTRGLSSEGVRGEDNVAHVGPGEIHKLPGQRALARFDAEEGLSYLAERTGGLMVKGSNDPGRGLDRVLEDQQGYYLIGYAPPASFFEARAGRPAFHKLQVSVRRPGLRVRSRAGFYGVADAATAMADESRAGRMAAALFSPFAAAELGLRLQALFMDDEKAGPSLRAMLRIDGRDLTFAETAEGTRQAVLDVVAVTFGEGGGAVDRKDQTFTIQAKGAEAPAADTALFYTVDLPVKKPGPYQFRVVVRDAASGRMGAAGEVVAVPDIKAGRLAVSGIVVRGSAADTASASFDGAQALVGRVKPGSAFEYVFQILNARRDPATARPRLETQVRLWRGREPVYEGARTALPVEHATEHRVVAGGRLSLSSRLPPGDYTLQVVVTDTLAPRAQAVATQWTSLEAIPAP
jgi:VWFA-related protein